MSTAKRDANDREWAVRGQARNLLHTVSARSPRPVRGFASVFGGPQIEVGQVRCQTALAETADELCKVVTLGVREGDILLGANVTAAQGPLAACSGAPQRSGRGRSRARPPQA